MAIFFAKASSAVFAVTLSDSFDALNKTTDATTGVRGDGLVNVMVVDDEVTEGVPFRADFVAVTKHVPGLFACSTAPLRVHFEVPPARTLKDKEPPPGSPVVRSVSDEPTVPARVESVNIGARVVVVVGMVVVVVVVEVVVVLVDVVVVVADVKPVPVNVIVCTPLPSLPSINQDPVTGPLVVGANCTVSWIDVAGAISSGGVVFASCTNGSVSALNPFVVGGVDEMIVKGMPPWSPSWKLNVADEPTATLPKLSAAGMVVI